MSNVIDFKAALEKSKPHVSGQVVCVGCKHRWTAVAPWKPGQKHDLLECPSCGAFKGVFADPLLSERFTEVMRCSCGCDAYMVVSDGTNDAFVTCINCGDIKGKFVC